MKPEVIDIETYSKHSISVTKYNPETSNQKSLVISSATGVLQKYYSKFAKHFSTLGYTVYTFDYYGIGESCSVKIKENNVSLNDWANDQASILNLAKQSNPNHKITLITHSIGGQLIGLNSKIHLADSIITIASQTGYWKYFKGINRLRMLSFWYVLIPIATPLFGYFPAKKMGLFENIPKNVVYQWRQWGIHPKYIFREFKTLQFELIKNNVLVLSFPRDSYAPKQAVDWLSDQFKNAQVDRKHIIPEDLNIEDIKHFGFFRSKFKDSLWKSTDEWILKNT